MRALALTLLVAVALQLLAVGSDGQPVNEDACKAQATASANRDNLTAEAISNAVTATFTKGVDCGDGREVFTQEELSDLTVAIAIAVAEAETSAQECTADAEARADVAGSAVADTVVDAIKNTTKRETNASDIVDARVQPLSLDIAESVRQFEQSSDEEGIEAFSSTAALPTADEIVDMISEAVEDILRGVQCEDISESDTKKEDSSPCKFLNGRFIGCSSSLPSEPQPSTTETSSGPPSDERQVSCKFINGRIINPSECNPR